LEEGAIYTKKISDHSTYYSEIDHHGLFTELSTPTAATSAPGHANGRLITSDTENPSQRIENGGMAGGRASANHHHSDDNHPRFQTLEFIQKSSCTADTVLPSYVDVNVNVKVNKSTQPQTQQQVHVHRHVPIVDITVIRSHHHLAIVGL
jgi:hypothetical protein